MYYIYYIIRQNWVAHTNHPVYVEPLERSTLQCRQKKCLPVFVYNIIYAHIIYTMIDNGGGGGGG